MSRVKNQTGMAEKEVENGSGQNYRGTVQGVFGETSQRTGVYDDARRICISGPEQIGNLLAGEAVSGSPYSWRECVQIKAGGTSTAEGGFTESCGRHLVCVNAVI